MLTEIQSTLHYPYINGNFYIILFPAQNINFLPKTYSNPTLPIWTTGRTMNCMWNVVRENESLYQPTKITKGQKTAEDALVSLSEVCN